jgi:hypothetical protein
VACPLNAGTVSTETTSVARLRHCKHAMTRFNRDPLLRSGRLKQHVTAATFTHVTIEELCEAVFCVRSVQRLYLENRNRRSYLPLFLVTLTRDIKSQEIFKLNSLRWSYTELRLALRNAIAKTLAMPGPTASNPLDVCVAVVATCIGNALERQIQNLRRAASIAL